MRPCVIGPLLLGLVLGSACGGEEEANEARLLLDRYATLEHPDLGERHRRVDAFNRLPLRSERVIAVRDACGPLQDALLEAEEQSTVARRLVERLEGSAPGERDPADAERVEAALGASNEALGRVRALRDPCESALAELRARYEEEEP